MEKNGGDYGDFKAFDETQNSTVLSELFVIKLDINFKRGQEYFPNIDFSGRSRSTNYKLKCY